MIRVNLLPSELRKRKRKPKPIPAFLFFTTILSLFVIIGFAYAMFAVKQKITGLESEKSNNEKEISELNKKLKDIENFEKLNQSFKQRKEIIEKLRKNQNLPVRIMNEVSGLLPPGVWLSSLSCKGEDINIEGYGFTNDDVVTYIDNIKKSSLFKDAYLLESKLATIENVTVYQFKISFKVVEK